MPSQVDCTIRSINIATISASEMESYLNEYMVCLTAAWYPPAYDANFHVHRPSVTVYTTKVNTPCGETPMENAFFCGADQQIYYALDLGGIFNSSQQTTRLTVEAILAHEFAHLVQYRAQILWSIWYVEDQADTDDEAWEWSRRAEMQADCWAGLFFHTISDSAGLTSAERDSAESVFRSIGSSRPHVDDHGMGTNRARWHSHGWDSTSPGQCNAMIAPYDDIG